MPFWDIHTTEMHAHVHRETSSRMFINTVIHDHQKLEKTQMSTNSETDEL